MRFWTAARAWREGVMTRTVSSPAIVPATSLNFSASSAAASGCAPEAASQHQQVERGRATARRGARRRKVQGSGRHDRGDDTVLVITPSRQARAAVQKRMEDLLR